jgi:hypothetical protein
MATKQNDWEAKAPDESSKGPKLPGVFFLDGGKVETPCLVRRSLRKFSQLGGKSRLLLLLGRL